MSLSLIIVAVAGLVAALWWQRRRTPVAATSLRVVQRAALGPKSGVALVEAEGARLLVAYGEGTPRLITRLSSLETEEDAS